MKLILCILVSSVLGSEESIAREELEKTFNHFSVLKDMNCLFLAQKFIIKRENEIAKLEFMENKSTYLKKMIAQLVSICAENEKAINSMDEINPESEIEPEYFSDVDLLKILNEENPVLTPEEEQWTNRIDEITKLIDESTKNSSSSNTEETLTEEL